MKSQKAKGNAPSAPSRLNPEQEAAVTSTAHNLLVLAGAGTGKTRTIIERAKHLLRSGVSASNIVILSFTRKAAKEIADRIKAEINHPAAKNLKGQTFHSWCAEMVARFTQGPGSSSAYTLLDEDDRDACFKLVSADILKNHKKVVTYKQVGEAYSYAVNARCSLSDAIRMKIFGAAAPTPDYEETIAFIKPLYEAVIQAYIKYKNEHGYWDYDDLLARVAKALRTSEPLRKAFCDTYRHILVDEAQDTNPLQYELLSSFYEDSHIFCVGDDAQSIYGFRGADFKTIHSFTSRVPHSQVAMLSLNYRSTQPVLDLANWLLRTSPLHYDKDLRSARGSGPLPRLIHWGSEWEEARHVADQMTHAVTDLGMRWQDNMVISRSLFGLKKVEALCIERKIPYAVYGGIGLMQSAHIRDVVSALRIVADWHDELAWMRYLELYQGVGPVTARKIISCVIDAPTLDDCLRSLDKCATRPGMALTLRRIHECGAAVSRAISAAVECMQELLAHKYAESPFKWEDRAKDFELLETIAAGVGSITELINEYVLDPKLGENTAKRPGQDGDHVILTTIHSAKGLEARRCYVLNVSTWAFPTGRALRGGLDAVEEERRCLYVALTRAKDDLFIYRNVQSLRVNPDGDDAPDDDDYARDTATARAYFLNGLPDRLVDSQLLTDAHPTPRFTARDLTTLLDTSADFDFS